MTLPSVYQDKDPIYDGIHHLDEIYVRVDSRAGNPTVRFHRLEFIGKGVVHDWKLDETEPQLLDDIRKHAEMGGRLAIVPSTIGAVVVDVDYGGWDAVQAVIDLLGEPAIILKSRRDDCYHLYYPAPKKKPRFQWEFPSLEGGDKWKGEVLSSTRQAVLWDGESLSKLSVAIREDAFGKEAPDFDLLPKKQEQGKKDKKAGQESPHNPTIDEVVNAEEGNRNITLHPALVSAFQTNNVGKALEVFIRSPEEEEKKREMALRMCRTFSRPEPDKPPFLRPHTFDEYRALYPPGIPIVEGLVETIGTTLILGSTKNGKTTVAKALAGSVATGKDFLGREIINPGPVLWMGLNEPGHTTIDPFETMGMDKAPIEYADPPLLGDFDAWKDWIPEAIENYRERKGRDYAMIVVDMLVNYKPGTKVSDYDAAGLALSELTDLSNVRKTQIVIIHHNRKGVVNSNPTGEDALGSQAIYGAVQGRITVFKRTVNYKDTFYVTTGGRGHMDNIKPPREVIFDPETHSISLGPSIVGGRDDGYLNHFDKTTIFTVRDFAREIDDTPKNARRILNGLVSRGWLVKKVGGDKRVHLYSLIGISHMPESG